VGLRGNPGRKLRATLAATLAIAAVLPLTACAASSSFAGIPLARGAAEPRLQALAQRAKVGDKQAQLELGIRYEEGLGVPVDIGRAKRLYGSAARESGGTTHVYSPPIGKNSPGRVLPISRGPRQAGLAEARARLAALESHEPGERPAPANGRAGKVYHES
jgi:hypothetical protein